MPHLNQAGLELIKSHEGFSPVPYRCPTGYMTIGYGHRIKPGETFPHPLTRKAAEALLRADASIAGDTIRRVVESPLNDNQFSALVSFVYNIGVGAFLASTLLKKLNAGKHTAVPTELHRWVWGRGKILPGLVKRREAEGELYERL